MRQEDKAYQKQQELFEKHKEKQTQYIIEETSVNELSLSELSYDDLLALKFFGHLGKKTKHLFELRFFYNRVEEEIKRRKLKEKSQK